MRLIVRWSMGLVAVAAATLSYQSLMRLALLCGYGGLAWVFPLVVDLGAAASCAAWLRDRDRQALVMAWSLLITSVLLNATTHYLASIEQTPSWPLAVAVAAVPPMVLGMTVHLAVGLGERDHHGQAEESRVGQSGRGREVPPGAVGSGESHAVDSDPGRNGLEAGYAGARTQDGGALLSPIDELLAQGAGRRTIANALQISEYEARKIIAASRNGDGR